MGHKKLNYKGDNIDDEEEIWVVVENLFLYPNVFH